MWTRGVKDSTWGSLPILAETSKYKNKECSKVRLKLFLFVVIIINVNFFSDSRTFVWPRPGASLQNMEAEVLAWAWANTLGNLVGTYVGGGVKEDGEMALGWGIERHLCRRSPSK